MKNIEFKIIGYIESCFKEKFGIPRQSGLVKNATAILRMISPYNQREAFSELDGFSHIWVQFIFHQAINDSWKATVRPPKLGGNRRVGIFATRSNYRPNPLGLSVVKLERIEYREGEVLLHLKGGDFLDKTPVIDIKPYLPYSDSIAHARGGFSVAEVEKLPVEFSREAEKIITENLKKYPELFDFITDIVQNDPRPGYRMQDSRTYFCRIFNFKLSWLNNGEMIKIINLEQE